MKLASALNLMPESALFGLYGALNPKPILEAISAPKRRSPGGTAQRATIIDLTPDMHRRKSQKRDWQEWLRANPGPIQALKLVANRFGISLQSILKQSRVRHINLARQGAIYVLRQYELSLPEIGFLLERDHSTVMHALDVFALHLRNDAKLWTLISDLVNEVESLLCVYKLRSLKRKLK